MHTEVVTVMNELGMDLAHVKPQRLVEALAAESDAEAETRLGRLA